MPDDRQLKGASLPPLSADLHPLVKVGGSSKCQRLTEVLAAALWLAEVSP